MNKSKLVIALIVFIIGTFMASSFLTRDDNNKSNEINIPDYKSNVFCKYSEQASDEDGTTYTSNVYISYNKGGDITEIVYQSVMLDDFSGSTVNTIKDLHEMYEGLKGITTDVYASNNYVISTITYDFVKLDLKEIRKELKSILDEESFLSVGKLPINYNDYIKDYLNEYTCEVR